MGFPLAFVLFSLLSIAYGSFNLRGQCVTGTLGVHIYNKYTDRLGNEHQVNYAVPNTVQVDAKCEDRYLQAKKAKIVLKFGQDKLTLDFKSGGSAEQPIYLTKLTYEYVKDRPRYPGVANEESYTVEQDYTDNEITFGTWGKTFKCHNVALNLGGGLKIELKDLQLALFKPSEVSGEASCPIGGISSGLGGSDISSGRFTTGRPSRVELTTRGSPQSQSQSSSYPQHLTFAKDNCLKGEADIKLSVNYKDDSYHNRSVSYYVPSDSEIDINCESLGITSKKVLIKFKFGRDVFSLEFSVPSISGTTVSLRMAEYKYLFDTQRFPGHPRPSEVTTTTVSNIYSEGTFPLGEKGKVYKCESVVIPMGRGVASAELINLRLSLFPPSRPSSLSSLTPEISCTTGPRFPPGSPTSRPSSPSDRATSRPHSPAERVTSRPHSPGDRITIRPQTPIDSYTSPPASPTKRPGFGPLTTYSSLP